MHELTDRIAELEDKRQEYIFNETSEKIGQESVSWGELADIQNAAWDEWYSTPEGQELIALLWADGNEKTMSLYYALKAMLNAFDIGQRAGPHSAIWQARAAIHQAEGE